MKNIVLPIFLCLFLFPSLSFAKNDILATKDMWNGFTLEQTRKYSVIKYGDSLVYTQSHNLPTKAEDIDFLFNDAFICSALQINGTNHLSQWKNLGFPEKQQCIREYYYKALDVYPIGGSNFFNIDTSFFESARFSRKTYDISSHTLYTLPPSVFWAEYIQPSKKWIFMEAMIGYGDCYNALYFLPNGSQKYQLLFTSENICQIRHDQYGRMESFEVQENNDVVVVHYVVGKSEDSLRKYSKRIHLR